MEQRFDVGRWVRMNARWRPEQAALKEGERSLSYRTLDERVDRLGHALAARGVGFGDRVAILAPNRLEVVEAVFGLARMGAIAVPLNYRLVARDLAFMLRDSGSRVLIYDPAFGELVAGLRGQELPEGLQWLALGEDYEAALTAASATPFAPVGLIAEDTPHLIMYTAGTTGLPKGVVLTHGNTFWQAINAVNLGMLPGTVGLTVLPLFHVGGLNGSVTPLIFIGGTVVLQRQFQPLETLQILARERVQGMVGVPAIFQMMAALPQFATTDLSAVVAFTSGGAPLPLHTIETYKERGIVFRQGYGLTEAAPGVTGMEPQDAYLKPGSVGRPCHHVEVRIADDAGEDCGPGAEGELWVRGPNVMPGYWNRPEETAATLHEGWLRTGDAARRDEDGYIWVAGRKKEMIISGGENIYPAEVANALSEHPAVADVAVVGAPDERWGQRPVAFVVLRPGMSPSPEEILASLGDRLARYKHPREIRFLPFLPRNATGKVLQPELRRLISEG